MTRTVFTALVGGAVIAGLVTAAVLSRRSRALGVRLLVITGVVAGLSAFLAVTFLHD